MERRLISLSACLFWSAALLPDLSRPARQSQSLEKVQEKMENYIELNA